MNWIYVLAQNKIKKNNDSSFPNDPNLYQFDIKPASTRDKSVWVKTIRMGQTRQSCDFTLQRDDH